MTKTGKARTALALAALVASGGVLAQEKTSIQAIEEYREMLQDGNPAELFEAKGEELWKKPRGPKNASLEKCDLGKGPGVVKGAFVELPRYFKDTGKVQDLESRLVTCMTSLQGIDAKEIVNGQWGRGERGNTTALATWIAAQSKGMTFNDTDATLFRAALKEAGFYSEWKGKYGDEAWAILEKAVGASLT